METIFIQETDQHLLDVLTQALELKNYQVYAIHESDTDFLSLIEQMPPHVVMLDYKLKGQQCLEIFVEIKKAYPHLPLIALSCNHNINTVAMEIGFDDYIKKPFDLDHLYCTLRKHIKAPTPSQQRGFSASYVNQV